MRIYGRLGGCNSLFVWTVALAVSLEVYSYTYFRTFFKFAFEGRKLLETSSQRRI